MIQRERRAGRTGDVVGRQARVTENRRSAHQQKHGPESRSLAEPLTKPAPRPQKRHHAGQHEEWQRADPGQRQASPVIVLGVEDLIALFENDRLALYGRFPSARRAQAVNERPQRADDAGQRRMAVLIGKGSLLQPFHAIGDMERLIVGAVENGVGCRNPGHAYRDQNKHADDVFVHRYSSVSILRSSRTMRGAASRLPPKRNSL